MRDYLEVSAYAHKVAGSAAVFGADQLRYTLKAIEAAAKVGDVKAIEDQALTFRTIWQKTKLQLSI